MKCGTELGIEKNRNFIPSHELVLSGLLSPENLPSVNLSLIQAVCFLRRDQLNIESVPAGWLVVKYLGINIGLIKNIGSRLNNYLPSDWRIRMEADPEKLRSIISWTG